MTKKGLVISGLVILFLSSLCFGETVIKNVTIFKHAASGFYMELYPEYRKGETLIKKQGLIGAKSAESTIFSVKNSERNGMGCGDIGFVISFEKIDETGKKKIKDFYGFGLRHPRNTEIENILHSNSPQINWEVYFYEREEEDRHLDYYAFFPQEKNELLIRISFCYKKRVMDIMKEKIKDMISTVKITDVKGTN